MPDRRAGARPRVFFLHALAGLLIAGSLSAAELSLERAGPRKLSPAEIAALPRGGSHLVLESMAFDPTRTIPDYSIVGLPARAAGQYGLVQFAPGGLDEKERLEKLGVRFFGYLPDNAFQVKLTDAAARLLAKNPAVRWTCGYMRRAFPTSGLKASVPNDVRAGDP